MISGCVRSLSQASSPSSPDASGSTGFVPAVTPTLKQTTPQARPPGAPVASPTPDPPHVLPTRRSEDEQYTVRSGDTLGKIAQRYGVDMNAIIAANDIANPDLLEVGVVLTIPAGHPLPPGPDFKIIPDSELVNSPGVASFDLQKFIVSQKGYLAVYQEEYEGRMLSGGEIIAQVARDYSVSPRLLLTVLEYKTGWVTRSTADAKNEYPLGFMHTAYKGLYRQLAWTANNLNRGYYLWKAGGIASWILADGSLVPPAPTLNAGTAAIQYYSSLLLNKADWDRAVSPDGIFAAYQALFGYPFDHTLDPLIPAGLTQPALQLPFEPRVSWSYTGGPHGGWGSGSGWAAIDFAPPGDALGCVQNDAWVVAVADGTILRAADGAVVQDLDGDGIEQTGWSILYMHIETRDRVKTGARVKAGDRIGHPSCEGGVSNGTHVHLARRYNGEWIPADSDLPFDLDGWISKGTGVEYDGWLTKGNQTLEAWDGRNDGNQISR